MSIKENQASAYLVGCAKLQPTPRHTMEDFLAAVAQAMNDSELSAAELIGCLEIVKAELLETIFDDADEA